jgi:hypothetical protein
MRPSIVLLYGLGEFPSGKSRSGMKTSTLGVGVLAAFLISFSLARAANSFNHTDVPLNLTVAQIENQFPQCQLSHGPNYLRNAPFTGYQPVFPQLTPNYEGQYLKGVGDDFSYYDFECAKGGSLYLTFFNDKSMIATKTGTEPGSDALTVINRMRASLVGDIGPVHEAIGEASNDYSPNQAVFVTYGDNHDIRTVIEVEANHSDDSMMIIIAYVNLSLWDAYSKVRSAEVKAYLDDQETQKKAEGNL